MHGYKARRQGYETDCALQLYSLSRLNPGCAVRQGEVRWAMGGRNKDKLEGVRSEVAAVNGAAKVHFAGSDGVGSD